MQLSDKTKSMFFSILLHIVILGLFILPFYLHSSKSYKIAGHIKITRAYFISSTKVYSPITPSKKHAKKHKTKIHASLENKAKLNMTHTPKTSAQHLHTHQKKKHNQPAQSKAISGEKLDKLIQIIYKSIDKHKVFPTQALALHQQGKVIINFKLYPNGVIKNIHLTHSSGFTSLDNAALKTLQATSPIQGIGTLLTTPQSFTIPISYHFH